MYNKLVLLLMIIPLIAFADQQERKNVAIFVFEGVQIIDYAAPYEVLGQARFNVYTVSEKAGTIKTNMNMAVTPTYDFSNAPKPYILVLPGGNVSPQLDRPAVLAWVKKSTVEAEHVLTVCNGAFFLAKTGLLDGLTATTFHGMIGQLHEAAPKAKVVRDKRFVDNGKIITSAGLTSGMDSSLYLVSKIQGMQKAKELALHLEYNWDPNSNYARAAMADRHLDQITYEPPPDSEWTTLRNYGDMNHWEYRVSTKKPAASELMKIVSDQLLVAKWTQKSADTTRSSWTFRDADGRPWKMLMEIENGPAHAYTVTFKVDRSS